MSVSHQPERLGPVDEVLVQLLYFDLRLTTTQIMERFPARRFAPGTVQQFIRRLREAPDGPRKRRVWTMRDWDIVETYYFGYRWEVREIIEQFPERRYEETELRQFIRRVREARGIGKQVHNRGAKKEAVPPPASPPVVIEELKAEPSQPPPAKLRPPVVYKPGSPGYKVAWLSGPRHHRCGSVHRTKDCGRSTICGIRLDTLQEVVFVDKINRLLSSQQGSQMYCERCFRRRTLRGKVLRRLPFFLPDRISQNANLP